MKQIIFALLLAFFTLSCSMQAQQSVKNSTYGLMLKTLLSHSVEEISVEAATELQNAVFLDTRAEKEFEVSHIKDATWVGYEEFKAAKVADLDKNQPIVVYCSVGYRSEKITEQLMDLGFTDVANLYGGIFEWVNQGNEVVDENGAISDKVHAFDKIWGVWLRISKENKVFD